MSVQLTADQEAELAVMAQNSQRTADDLAQEAVSNFLAQAAQHRELIEKARAQIERGEWIEHEEVFARIKTRLGW